MSTLFEELKQGLEEAISYTKGEGAGKRTTYVFSSSESLAPDSIDSSEKDMLLKGVSEGIIEERKAIANQLGIPVEKLPEALALAREFLKANADKIAL